MMTAEIIKAVMSTILNTYTNKTNATIAINIKIRSFLPMTIFEFCS